MYAYCLFCDSRHGENIAKYLEKHGFNRAFSPKIVKHQRKNGVNEEVVYDLLPGYVFAYSEEVIQDTSWMQRITGAIRLLRMPEENGILSGSDEVFARKLYECDGFIGAVRLMKDGDAVTVEESVFKESNEKVLEIDYRKRRVKIEFAFGGMTFRTWVACKIRTADGKD